MGKTYRAFRPDTRNPDEQGFERKMAHAFAKSLRDTRGHNQQDYDDCVSNPRHSGQMNCHCAVCRPQWEAARRKMLSGRK